MLVAITVATATPTPHFCGTKDNLVLVAINVATATPTPLFCGTKDNLVLVAINGQRSALQKRLRGSFIVQIRVIFGLGPASRWLGSRAE